MFECYATSVLVGFFDHMDNTKTVFHSKGSIVFKVGNSDGRCLGSFI